MKKRVSSSFSLEKKQKIDFWVLIENWQKNWHVWHKKLLLKKYSVENDQKKKNFFFYEKMLVWIKDDRDSVTQQKNLQKNRFEIRKGFLSPFFFKILFVHASVINHDRSNLSVHNISFHTFRVMHACIIRDIKWNTYCWIYFRRLRNIGD